jgi:hypothetical protein
MPELIPQSTAAPAPPPVPPGIPPIPSEDPPYSPAAPPTIKPEDFEKYPTFRETFLVMLTDPDANATMRALGLLLLDFVLAIWGEWPSPPEGMLFASLRAAIADMRHLEGSILEWTDPEKVGFDPAEVRPAGVARKLAGDLGALADRLERTLGTRGEE